MKGARNVAERRILFMKGVGSLVAGNLPAEALKEGEANLAGLQSDREALLFMTKIGLAAGKPGAAQRFIAGALGMRRGSGGGDGE
jgi:hypothetical protein